MQRGHLSVLSSCHLSGTARHDSLSGSRTAGFLQRPQPPLHAALALVRERLFGVSQSFFTPVEHRIELNKLKLTVDRKYFLYV